MSTPTPTPPPAIPELFFDFFWTHWLGQLLLGAAIVAIIARIFRVWIQHRLVQLWSWLRDLRITRESTTQKKIKDAVSSAVAVVRAELAPPPDPWAGPAVVSEEEVQAMRDRSNHQANLRNQWSLSTDGERKHGFVLHNHAARTAQQVRLDGARGFEFLDDAKWEEIKQDTSTRFLGRVVDAKQWKLFDREIEVHWVDDHGDAQVKRIQVDRTSTSTADLMLGR